MDTKQLAADLDRIADELRARNADPDAELTLWDWEESGGSGVIGTAAGFLRLAEAAVRAAADAHAGRLMADPERDRCLYGAAAAYSFAFEGLFDFVSGFGPEKAVVMETEGARKGVARHRGRIMVTTDASAGAEPDDEPPSDEPPTPGSTSNRPTTQNAPDRDGLLIPDEARHRTTASPAPTDDQQPRRNRP